MSGQRSRIVGGTQDVFYSRASSVPLPMMARADGVWFWDEDGKAYIDASSGPMVSAVGALQPAHHRRDDAPGCWCEAVASEKNIVETVNIRKINPILAFVSGFFGFGMGYVYVGRLRPGVAAYVGFYLTLALFFCSATRHVFGRDVVAGVVLSLT